VCTEKQKFELPIQFHMITNHSMQTWSITHFFWGKNVLSTEQVHAWRGFRFWQWQVWRLLPFGMLNHIVWRFTLIM